MAGSTAAIRRSAASINSSGLTSPRFKSATASVAVSRNSSVSGAVGMLLLTADELAVLRLQQADRNRPPPQASLREIDIRLPGDLAPGFELLRQPLPGFL